MENEEEGTEILTEQTLKWIRVADMIGSTLEEVCNMTEFERNELLSLIPAIDEHRDEDHGKQVLAENQDDNFILKAEADENRKDEARAKVIAEIHRDVEMVKVQLTDVKSVPSDDEIYAYLEAHLKRENRIQIVADELRGINFTEAQNKNHSPNRVEPNDQTGASLTETRKRKLSSCSDETSRPPKISKIEDGQAVPHGNEASHSSRPALDIAEQMIQSAHEDDINTHKISSQNLKELNSNQEQMALPKRPETPVGTTKDAQSMEVLVKTVLEMVPNINQEYLRVRVRDLVGHDAAIERFVLEILNDPTPPANWRQIFAEPFQQTKPNDGLVKKEKNIVMSPSTCHTTPSTHVKPKTGHTTPKVKSPFVPSQLNVNGNRKSSSPTTILSKTSSESIRKHIPGPSAKFTSSITQKPGSSSTFPVPKLILAGCSTAAPSNPPTAGPSTPASNDPPKLFSVNPNTVAPSNQPSAGPSTSSQSVGEKTPQDVLPGGLAPQDVLHGGQAPHDVLPGGLAPQDVLPGGLVPQDVLPDGLAHQNALPGGLAHQNVLPDGLAHQDVLPGGLAPQDVVPGSLALQNVLPGGLAPQNVIPEEAEEVDPEAVWQRDKEAYLIEVFPEYSPEWLVKQIQVFKMNWGTDDGRFNEHVAQIMEMDKRFIPSRKAWEKQVKEREELDKWSGNMTVNDMLELYDGDPAKHFKDPKRKGIVDNRLYWEHSRMGLLDAFRYASKPIVDKEFRKAQNSFALAHKALRKMPNTRKTKRHSNEIKYPASPCIEFMKEKKFVELRKSIYNEKVKRDVEKRKALEAARLTNALVECECCYNECLDQDMVPCNAGHLYCKDCVGESVNVAMGEGKTIILCLGQCEEEINTRELQLALPPNVLSKLLSKRQADEVGAADIENLVTCPFCPYSTIMENEQDKVVVCRNPDCGRESCRLCKEPSHIPLRCEEVTSKDNIRKRVEEALSDAIIRKCANPKCPASFMKTEGCNKMVCPKCGAVQCYLCKIIVPGYEHFYGQGGEPTKTRVCPLWSDNDELHASEVSKAAQKEAEELKKDGVELEYNAKEGIKLLETKK